MKSHNFRAAEIPDYYAMLMRPNKAKTAAHRFHCPVDVVVRVRKIHEVVLCDPYSITG